MKPTEQAPLSALRLAELLGPLLPPGLPTNPATTMGALASRAQLDETLHCIETAKSEGARLVCGGSPPADPALRGSFFVEPTVFADVTPEMTIAHEEIFGPVLAVMKWSAEAVMIEQVNRPEYGLTCSIWTNDIHWAHRTTVAVEAGFIWVNEVSKHFLDTPSAASSSPDPGGRSAWTSCLLSPRKRTSTSVSNAPSL